MRKAIAAGVNASFVADKSMENLLAETPTLLVAPLFAVMVFGGLGNRIGYAEAARIHVTNLPARYLPGGIWHTVGRVIRYREIGVEKRHLAAFVFLENALSAATAFILGGTLLVAFRGLQGWGGVAALAVVASIVGLGLVPTLLKIRVFATRMALRGRYYLAGIVSAMLSWCVAASAFVAFVAAFPTLPVDASRLEIVGAYLFSWGIGFIAIFAPQGVGVFEVAAAELLGGSADITSIVPLIAMFRLVILTADVLAWTGLQLAGLMKTSGR